MRRNLGNLGRISFLAVLAIAGLFIFQSRSGQAEFFGDLKLGLQPIVSDRYGASVFVPNSFTRDRDWPLVVVMYSDESEKGNAFSEKWLSEFRNRQEIALFISFLRPRETPMSSDERVKRLIGEVKKMYPIDENRVLLTAYGEAAHYAFYLGHEYPELFSAVGVAAGGAAGIYEPFFHHDAESAKEMRYLVLYGEQDATIQKDQFTASLQELKGRGFQIELEEFQGLDHQFHPQYVAKILNWFEGLPVVKASQPEPESTRTSSKNMSLGLPHYIEEFVRGLFGN